MERKNENKNEKLNNNKFTELIVRYYLLSPM